jgi:dTDP-4-amino-4,6-dideoxygalactose transaminase
MAAALGLSQLTKLPALQMRRDRIAQRYLEALEPIPGVRSLAKVPEPADRHSWCVFAIAVDKDVAGISRDDLIVELRRWNIGTSVHFIPTHQFSAYRNTKRGDLSVTERISQRMLSLPLYPGMTKADVDDVIEALGEIVAAARAAAPLETAQPSI